MIQDQFDEFVLVDTPNIPLPGSGSTWHRFSCLAERASLDLSLGRLCEGHADAVAILAEAEMKPIGSASYGVWASRSSAATTFAERVKGGWRLSGRKEFCSGARTLQRALVTAASEQGHLLFDVDVNEHVASVVDDSWPSVGMAASMSETVEFSGSIVKDDHVVGPADFYLQRPGFWFGATGVAACWFGGSVAFVNDLLKWVKLEPTDDVLVDLGRCVSALETMRHALRSAADAIDDDPSDDSGHAKFRALVTRQIVHGAALTVLEKVASAGGARPLSLDGDQSRRAADLYVYLSQQHGSADAAELGRTLMRSRSWS
jgi:alkylation response protein AidB-like acyl-CoA dehydrogenase